MNINQKLKMEIDNIIGDTFSLDTGDIHEKQTPDDIEKWDSLGQLKLINNFEENLGIVFTMEEIFQIISIEDIYNIIKNKIK